VTINHIMAEKRARGSRNDKDGRIILKVDTSAIAPMTMPVIAQLRGRNLYINEGTATPATSNPIVATCAVPPAAKPSSCMLLIVSKVSAIPGCESTQPDRPEIPRNIEAAIPPKNAMCTPLAVTPRKSSLLVRDAVNIPSVIDAPSWKNPLRRTAEGKDRKYCCDDQGLP